jgi:tetratricopeptide (TPR) repeat protein
MNSKAPEPKPSTADKPTGAESASPLPNSPSAVSHLSTVKPLSRDLVDRLPAIPDYQLLQRIGGGSYGEVWLARSATGVLRALKIVWRHTFDDDRPFQREFEGIQKFERLSREHPSQLALYHVGRGEGYFFYVMELADPMGPVISNQCSVNSKSVINDPATGTSALVGAPERRNTDSLNTDLLITYQPHTLRADLAHGRLPAARVLEIALTLTSALRALHEAGLVHRDIKPSNIIFVGGRPKLADIGLVTDAGDVRSIVGTEGYLAPEGPGTPQADLFALGKVLYEAATGLDRRQFPQLPPDLRAWPDSPLVFELNEVLLRSCAHDALQRYRSAEEMRAELELLQRGQSVKRNRAFGRRWKLAKKIALAAIVLAGVVASAMFAFRELHRNQPLSSDPKARELYVQAVYLQHSSTLDEQLRAFTNLTDAVKLDPNFVDAYYMMFETYAGDLGNKLPPHTNQMANLRWVADNIALRGRPNSAQYHTVNSLIKFLDWHFDEAFEQVKLALERDRKLLRAHVLYGWYMLLVRRDAVTFRTEFKTAELLEGSDMIVQQHLGTANYFERNFLQAIEQYQNALRLEKRAYGPHWFLGHIYAAEGHYDEALIEYEAAEKMRNSDIAQTEASYKRYQSALAEKGPRGMWQAMLEELRQSPSPDAYDMATFCARLGDKEEALELLEKAYQQHSGGMIWLQIDDWWDPLRDHPRFKVLLKEMGFSKVVPARK